MSRVRTRSESEEAVQTRAILERVNSACSCTYPQRMYFDPAGDIVSSYVPFSKTETMTDELTPHWEKCRDEGLIVVNPMVKSTTILSKAPGYLVDTRISGSYTTCNGVPTTFWSSGVRYQGTVSPEYLAATGPSTPSISIQDVMDIATAKAYSKIGEDEVAGLVVLAEGEKTIRSLISIGSRLYRILKRLRKHQYWALRRELTPKELADRWMEGRYAIRPLVYDMIGLMKAYKKTVFPYLQRRTYRGGHTLQAENSLVASARYTAGSYRLWVTKKVTRGVSARSGVLCAVDEVSRVMIYGLDKPFEAIWELIPFSFVVDWFLTVGATIGSWTPKIGFKNLASWVTVVDTVETTTRTHHVEDLYVPNQYTMVRELGFYGGANDTTVIVKRRVANPSRAVLPSWNLRLDGAKLLDLVLILRKFFS